MNNILLSQSFGKESEYRRVILAILSAFVYVKPTDIKVVLYTDNPEFFKKWLSGIDVHYVLLTPEKVKTMRGEIDFLHRMKIALIEESFALFPEHNMFYIDSDTFFIKSPLQTLAEVSESSARMHLLEYPFSDIKDMPLPAGETFQAFYKLIDNNEFLLSNGENIKVLSSDASWNAGVMCFHHTHQRFIADAYTLTNQFYPSTKNHASEQYAFSILLQKFTTLKPCEDVVYHYWYRVKKEVIDLILEEGKFKNIESLNIEQKLRYLKPFVQNLSYVIENHYLMYLDNAVQTFNENKFSQGYKWYLKAFFKNPSGSLKMFKDVLYHTKKLILG